MLRALALAAALTLLSPVGALGGPAAEELVLIDAGRARACIVTPADPSPDLTLAADELQRHLRLMTGVSLPVERASGGDDRVAIRLGLALAPELAQVLSRHSQDPAAFAIDISPDGVALAGNSDEGTLFAAYEFLEQLGCRWYMPGDLGTVVPRRERVALPFQRRVRAPSFPSRHLQAVSGDLPWYRRQRLGGPYFPSCHGIPLEPPADFASEPELFALVDGERRQSQLCVSHPEVLERATAAVLRYFDEHPEAPWIGMGPNDGGGYCECDRCRALDAGEWDAHAAAISMTDRYVWLFNGILERIEDRYPDRRIGFYAYAAHKLPPRRRRPDPRVVPALAPITLCRIHGLDNPVCPDRSFYRQLMAEWGALLPEVYERGYYFNLADPGFPFSKVHAVRGETPYAHRAGIAGWRVECMPSWSADTPTLYVAARLMWDVDTDVDALLADFYDGFFGPAAAPMGEYLDSIDRAYRDCDCHAGSSHCLPRIFPDLWRAAAARRLDEAESLAATPGSAPSVYARRLGIFRMAHERLEAFLDMLRDRDHLDFAAAHEHLADLRARTDTMLDYDLGVEAARLLYPRSAHSYLDRFWTACVEQGYERTCGRGRLVAGLPEAWDFLVDPTGVGEASGWHRDGAIGGGWQPLHTTAATWSEQGLHYYKGAAWYRTRVDLPQAAAGDSLYLFFGGVDEKATVWLNGELAGESAVGSFRPFDLDVTGLARPGAANTVAVRVLNEKLNEVGTGGITAPVFFWRPGRDGRQ